jgi:HK97 family phage major capsid protein
VPDIDKALMDELKSTWEGAFKPLNDRLDDEAKKFGDAFAETKESLDRVDARIDELDGRLQKMHLDGKGAGEVDAAELKAFEDWARKGVFPTDREVKDVTVGVNTQAGYLVPTEYARDIIRGITEFSPVRQIAHVQPVSSQSLQQPKRTGLPTATWRGETQSFTETNPTVGLEEIPTHELGAFVDVSMQMLEDGAVDIATYIRDELAEAFGVAEGTAFTTGNGVTRPEGFITSITAQETATNDTFVADDVIDLYFSPKTGYIANSAWMCNRQIMKVIRKMKGTDNNYLLQPGLADEPNWQLLGRPVHESPDMAASVADAAKVLAFGDFRKGYKIVDRIGFTLIRDDYTQAGNGMVRFYARRRVGGQVVLSEAIKVLEVN